MNSDKEKLLNLIESSNKIVIFSGAGASTDSGIKDFRSHNGLYSKRVYGLSPEKILSAQFFDTHKDLFYEYYMENLLVHNVKANQVHLATKHLSDEGKLVGVITQNIDGLYQKAGLPSGKLVEIHGNGQKWVCPICRRKVDLENLVYSDKTGLYLSPCHNKPSKPDIILYDEEFNIEDINKSNSFYENADLLIVMGTSLSIPYHTDKINRFKGKTVLINNRHVDLHSRPWDAEHIGPISEIFNTHNFRKFGSTK